MSKRGLIRENEHLRQRVKCLENIICPAEQHDWYDAESWFTYGLPHNRMAVIRHDRQICKRCFAERTVETE